MSLYVAPKQSIISAANTQNGTTLTVADVTFGVPNAAPSDVVTTTGKNSQVRLTGNGTTWSGTVVVNYNRLNLADITTLTSGTLKVAALSTTLEVLNYLNYFYGMVLTSDDVANEPVTLDANGAGSVTLHAKADSMGWIGQVTLNLVKGDAIVDYAVTDLSLSGINYPTNQSAKGQAPLVLYPYDYTAQFSVLNAIAKNYIVGSTSDTVATGLRDAINIPITNVNYKWKLTAGADVFNLQKGVITYNGLNSPEFASNQDYKYVMMITLDSQYCSNFAGMLYLHYNDPA